MTSIRKTLMLACAVSVLGLGAAVAQTDPNAAAPAAGAPAGGAMMAPAGGDMQGQQDMSGMAKKKPMMKKHMAKKHMKRMKTRKTM